MIGIIEYLKEPRWVLARAAQAASRIIDSYDEYRRVICDVILTT